MSKEELSAYYRHMDNTVILKDNIYTSRGEGLLEGREMGRKEKEGMREGIREGMKKGMKKGMEKGRKEGIEEGMKKGREEAMAQMLKNLKSSGASVEFMTNVTGLTEEEIDDLL